jgi:hypothetical protein
MGADFPSVSTHAQVQVATLIALLFIPLRQRCCTNGGLEEIWLMVQDYRMEAVPWWREGRWKEGDVAAKHVCEQVRAPNHLLPVFGSSRPLFIATEHSLVASALR